MPEVATLQQAFNVTLLVCVFCLMMSAGLLCQPQEVISYFRGSRLALTLKVILANMLLIPAVTIIGVYFIPMDGLLPLFLFLLAITPAAPLAPALVELNGGDFNWAVSLMFVMSILSLITIPPLLLFASQSYFNVLPDIRISSSDILSGYVVPVFAPLLLGFFLSRFLKRIACLISPFIDKAGKFLNLPLMVLAILINRGNFNEVSILTTVLLCLYVILIAFLAAAIIYPLATKQQYATAIVTTGVRNFGIMFLLLNMLGENSLALIQMVVFSTSMILMFMCSGFFRALSVKLASG